MIFPIYNAIESLDHNQVEAARDLGSPWWRIHWRVVIPFAKPGIVSGCTMVFMLTAGALAAPQILGGPSSLWFTQIIYQWFNTGQNWARGSAYAVVLLITCIILVLALMRVVQGQDGRDRQMSAEQGGTSSFLKIALDRISRDLLSAISSARF